MFSNFEISKIEGNFKKFNDGVVAIENCLKAKMKELNFNQLV